MSANCVVVAGRRGGESRFAACVVLATTRADVNGAVRRRLDARKASFAPMDLAVAETGMEYGGITPLGLPGDWPLLVDEAVVTRPFADRLGPAPVQAGAGRGACARLPAAEVLPGLGIPVTPAPE